MKANEAPENVYLALNAFGDIIKDQWQFHRLSDDDIEYIRKDIVNVLVESEGDNGYGKGCEYTKEAIKEALLSEVLPCFMHGGEADEVVAKLDEVLNQK